jgi:septum site-determining protein MinD
MAVILTVASIKGGVGKTTIAENLGITLGRMGRRVLIVDADITTSGMSTLLGLADREPNLHDLLGGRGDPPKAIYDAYGIKVLPSGHTLGGFVRADQARLSRVIDGFRQNFDVVIIDTPPGLTKYNLVPLKLADSVLSVTTQDPAAVESAAKLDEVAQTMGLKIAGVVVNRVRKSSFMHKLKLLNKAQVQARLKSKIIAAIPEDVSVMEAATVRRPAVFYKPKSEVAKSIRALAVKLNI